MKINPFLPKLVFVSIYHSNRKANRTEEIKPEEINQPNPQSRTRHKEIILALKLKGVGCGFSKDQRKTKPESDSPSAPGDKCHSFPVAVLFYFGIFVLFSL